MDVLTMEHSRLGPPTMFVWWTLVQQLERQPTPYADPFHATLASECTLRTSDDTNPSTPCTLLLVILLPERVVFIGWWPLSRHYRYTFRIPYLRGCASLLRVRFCRFVVNISPRYRQQTLSSISPSERCRANSQRHRDFAPMLRLVVLDAYSGRVSLLQQTLVGGLFLASTHPSSFCFLRKLQVF